MEINKNFNQEQLEEEVEIQISNKKRKNFHMKINEINKILSKTKFLSFPQEKVWPILLPFFFVMIFLVILPLVSIIVYAVIQPTSGLSLFRITMEKFIKMFTEANIMKALFLSIAYAFFAALICIFVGYPIAFIMSNLNSKIFAKNIWIIVTMPIWISMLLRALGLNTTFFLLAPSAIGTPIAIIIAMVYMFLPFCITPIYDALESRRYDLEEASQDLGLSKTKTFWSITFRYSMPGVITGFTLVLIQAATSLIVVTYFGGGKIRLITSIIESYFFKGNDFGFGAAISVILAIIICLLLLITRWFSGKFEMKGKKKRWKNSLRVVTSQ